MGDFQWIFFDCMETLVDLTQLPAQKDYALWAFQGSGREDFWEGFEEFFCHYQLVKKTMGEEFPQFQEHEISRGFERVIRLKAPDAPGARISAIRDGLCRNFWTNYVAKCYVQDEVKMVLRQLVQDYQLGVVSNFTVMNGIEELLKKNGIDQYFRFVITSVKEGWRKPHPRIYQAALERARVAPESVLFVGDDFECDYAGPGRLGFRTLLLDRSDRFLHVPARVRNFPELLALAKPGEKGRML
ncbi:HAD family hydrolase [Candidatus Formimonas warabiya]|uniref:HAD family hydrolase n=1 Tax=Formimonas warabiya TaxID=1761012 RepID=A0A3G1KWP1_FORW1|nr:HAD family hydrolase [Candidatus Formimonas warabiya]ATW26894.1 hypothetical protein DCMF_20920 [Candidatus Formimonas warabiya]